MASRTDIIEQAARAARRAADEASTPEARFFPKQHANLLARIAAKEGRAKGAARRPSRVAAFIVPLLEALPG